MSARRLEEVLARLYVDDEARGHFLRDPQAWAARTGLDAREQRALVAIDRTGLAMAARSFAAKRSAHRRGRRGVLARLLDRLRR